MLKQINYLTFLANEHVTQAMDHVGEVTGRTWRPFAWGLGWKQWFFGVVVYRRLTTGSTVTAAPVDSTAQPDRGHLHNGSRDRCR